MRCVYLRVLYYYRVVLILYITISITITIAFNLITYNAVAPPTYILNPKSPLYYKDNILLFFKIANIKYI
jgi:hypothetical protein